ncbi:MAG: NAD-dependent epimerase/dehydratase family protein [Myxococcota bacterium]
MKVLVTGAGGYLGGAVARGLLARGDAVRSFSRGDYPALRAAGVETIRGDLSDEDAVRRAVAGCDAVVHAAANVGGWGDESAYVRANVEGTDHVVRACRAAGVSRLVFTSTPSVVHDGRDLEGVDESVPYATRFSAAYPRTKATAERRVRAANDDALATVALRPHLVWGPGDPHLIPRTLERARKGRLRLPGGPPKWVDHVFIDDAARAHLDALDHLDIGARCAGRAYFISAGEPVRTDVLINAILTAHDLPPVTSRLPPAAFVAAARVAEATYRRLRRREEPPITVFAAEQLTTSHYFDITAARRDLGYAPQVTLASGLTRLRRAATPTPCTDPS